MQRANSQGEHYLQFLQSLDDEDLLQHIRSVLQNVLDVERPEVATKVPSFGAKIRSQLSNVSSDPFDDGLDNLLLNIGAGEAKSSGKNDVPVDPTPLNYTVSLPETDSSSEEERYQANAFGDYSSYFRKKRLKQQETDEKYVKWHRERRKMQGEDDPESEIFKGCAVHVNGYTEPLLVEIHRLVIIHGGTFIGYLVNKAAATHIICDRLTPRKRIMFKNYRVVKAQWIVDCIAKGTLLPWEDYRLIDEVAFDQSRLSFGKAAHLSDDNPDQIDAKDPGDLDEGTAESENENEIESSILSLQKDEVMLNNSQESRKEHITYLNERQKNDRRITLDAKHPDFLRHFFANSRLHHLSSWKADLRRQFLRRIISSKSTSQPTAPEGKRVILHVDFDSFFVTASCLNYPHLDISKQPIAVSHGSRTSDVASCNYVARKYGIKNGQWLGGAKKKCPELITVDYDFDAYERCSKSLYNYLIDANIFDSIFPVLIDEVLLDATTYCMKYGDDFAQRVRDLSSTIREKVYELTQCPVSVGASYNVLLAKLALRKAKPNGQFQLFDDILLFLSPFKVNDLPGVGPSHREKLQELMNITRAPTVEDLRKYLLSKLSSALGDKTGQKLYNYARGIDSTSITIDLTNKEAVLGRKSVSVDVNYGIRFDTVLQLDDFFMRLARELYERLVSLGICGSQLTLRLAKRAQDAPVNPPKFLGMGKCDFVSKSSRLGVPTNDWGVIGSELKAVYRMSNVTVSELRGIAVTMTHLEDVDSMTKTRQAQLPFYRSSDTPSKEKVQKVSPKKKQAGPIERGTLQLIGIDFEVLQELPKDIRNEIISELNRRDLSSRDVTKDKGKTFLQQLFPMHDGDPTYVRTTELPKPSPKRRKTVLKSPLPHKSKKEVTFSDVSSFDLSILEQLPLSVQEEIKKDLAYKKKVENLKTTSMRDKFLKEKNQRINLVNDEWCKRQTPLTQLPHFQGEVATMHSMKQKIRGWIDMSLNQQGPHKDDVDLFVSFIKDLIDQDGVYRCIPIIDQIRSELLKHQAILNCQPNRFVDIGIKEWNAILLQTLIPILKKHCEANNITPQNALFELDFAK